MIIRDQGQGIWDQGPGTWDLGPGTRDQGPGTWDLLKRSYAYYAVFFYYLINSWGIYVK